MQEPLQLSASGRRSAHSYDREHVETAPGLGEGIEGVPRDSSARAAVESGPKRLAGSETNRDVRGRGLGMGALLDRQQDVGGSKPVQARCRTAADVTPGPALVAEPIRGHRQNLAGIHELRSQIALRPIPTGRQDQAVAVTRVLDCARPLALWAGLRIACRAGATARRDSPGDQRANSLSYLHLLIYGRIRLRGPLKLLPRSRHSPLQPGQRRRSAAPGG
jgi:hypothetical protein